MYPVRNEHAVLARVLHMQQSCSLNWTAVAGVQHCTPMRQSSLSSLTKAESEILLHTCISNIAVIVQEQTHWSTHVLTQTKATKHITLLRIHAQDNKSITQYQKGKCLMSLIQSCMICHQAAYPIPTEQNHTCIHQVLVVLHRAKFQVCKTSPIEYQRDTW